MSTMDTLKKTFALPGMRAMIAFVIVTIALVVALWPRGTDEPSTPAAPSSPPSGITDQTVAQSEIDTARRDAALNPCPTGAAVGSSGPLAGVTAPCMGDGSTIDVGAATAGKPLVINMWAVWCLPCRRELPLFDRLSAASGDKLNVLAVHAREGGDKPYFVLKFLQEVGVHLPVVTDPQGSIAQAVKAPRVFPSTVFVRADGSVAAVLPRVFETYEDLTGAVREHLGVDLGAAS